MRTVAAHLASLLQARRNCVASGNSEWLGRHSRRIELIERNHLPHGAGIDVGVKLDLAESTPFQLVLKFSYHCMNQDGYYDGWRDYTAKVKPTFDGIAVTIHGRDYNGVKDYLHDVFREALSAEIELPVELEGHEP